MGKTILELNQIKKNFGDTEVLKGISLAIEEGEFITFLGSSGCGKTTTLRIIAGLEMPDEGRVLLEGADVTDLEPNKRDVNTVFQNYALFPHMDVYSNIAYGLKLKKTDKAKIREKVTAMLDLVQLSGFEKRMPSELSGGQKQRVAIARAVINNPKVLLLDEPLGALDLQLRRQMQAELKRLQKQLGITFIYITHDQEEAINMSDRIVVMRDGEFEQIGTPSQVYDFPRTSYVASFVGSANIMTGTLKDMDQKEAAVVETEVGIVKVKASGDQKTLLPAFVGKKVVLAVRSENMSLSYQKMEYGIEATVKEKTYMGGVLRITLDAGPLGELVSSRQGMNDQAGAGEKVWAYWKPEQAVLVDLEA